MDDILVIFWLVFLTILFILLYARLHIVFLVVFVFGIVLYARLYHDFVGWDREDHPELERRMYWRILRDLDAHSSDLTRIERSILRYRIRATLREFDYVVTDAIYPKFSYIVRQAISRGSASETEVEITTDCPSPQPEPDPTPAAAPPPPATSEPVPPIVSEPTEEEKCSDENDSFQPYKGELSSAEESSERGKDVAAFSGSMVGFTGNSIVERGHNPMESYMLLH